MESSGHMTYQGRLGTTTRASVHVTSGSGSTFPATVYSSINVTDSPELLQQLAAGTLHQVSDPASGTEYSLAQPVMLHDPSRAVMALFLPDALRHRESEERRRVLGELDKDDSPLPRYVREFAAVYTVEEFESLHTKTHDEAPVAAASDAPIAASPDHELEEAQAEIAAIRAQVEVERSALAVERQQLADLRERFDRERTQMDEIETRITSERSTLKASQEALEVERRRIEAEKLNLEQRLIDETHGGPISHAEESTQIVTDDQFIELSATDDADGLASEVSEIADEGIEEFEPESTMINPLMTGLPSRFADYKVPGDRVEVIRDEHVVFAARAPRTDIEGLFADVTECFIQLHEIENYPVIGLVLVNLDEGKATASVGWALDISKTEDVELLERLAQGASMRVGLYEPLGSLLRAVEIQAPIRSNVTWIMEQAAAALDNASGSFEPAAKKYTERGFERVGAMRHPFFGRAFDDLTSTSEVKLAAGILGFWSQPEKLRYVIANRSFPLRRYEIIRDAVIQAAVESGIYLSEELRDRAIELGLATNEDRLAEMLVANFAEVCVSIRVNDLDPAAQWDNWDALLGLGEELGIPPDSDVVELAEVSLKRAQELAELNEVPVANVEAGRTYSVDRTLVVARQSESTGVTYFLPDDAIVDSFDDIAGMSKEDLELLVLDPKGRLEASQVLIERFGADTLTTVLEASESMNSPEVAALARFVETKSGSLEGELVRSLGSMGPSGSYVAIHALSSIRSSTAIPAILDIIKDPVKRGDANRLVRVIAQYGDRLLPALTRAVKRDGTLPEYVNLLAALEDVQSGTLANLSKDRSKVLRDAARMAREKRDVR